MALKPPPTQHPVVGPIGRMSEIWVRWMQSLVIESETGFTGSWVNAQGDTVTVVNGKITDVS